MKDMRPDRSPRELRDLLHGVVPDSPDPAGRADGVVRRAKRASRRRGTASAAAVALVALTVIVGPHLLPGSPVSNGASGAGVDTSAAAARLARPFSCPTRGEPTPAVSKPPTNQVPAGAVLARICPESGSAYNAWSAPLDALTTDVSGLADSYNSLPAGRALPCPPPVGGTTGFVVTFQYPNGHLVQLQADSNGTGGCDLIGIEGRSDLGRSGPGVVMDAYFTQLLRQRSAEAPPSASAHARLTCPPRSGRLAPGLIPPSPALGMTRAVVCQYLYALGPHRVVSGVLSRSQAQEVDEDYASRVTKSSEGTGCTAPFPPDIEIIGRTAWGDLVVLTSDCAPYTRDADYSHGQLFWTPSRPVELMLDSLLEK